MSEELKDVKDPVNPTPDNQDNKDQDNGDDKDKNFANLRKQLAEKDAELAKKNKELEDLKGGDRNLDLKKDEEDGTTKKKDVPEDTIKVIFQRDMKEAVRQFTKKVQVNNEEWQQIKSKVSLRGDETTSEIVDKINEAYETLPSVRKRKEKEAFDKGRKLAMSHSTDDELDFADGGDVDLGDIDASEQIDPRSRTFARSLGLSNEEISKIDANADVKGWKVGKNPTRKFFQG